MASEATTVMSLIPDSPLRTAIMLLVVAAVVLIVVKPDFMYDRENRFKSFGTGPDQTLMPFWLSITLVGLFGYYLSSALSD